MLQLSILGIHKQDEAKFSRGDVALSNLSPFYMYMHAAKIRHPLAMPSVIQNR